MKFSFRILAICILTSLVIASCKKEDDNINNDINPNGGDDNVETVFGCMVDTACNYNNLATVDNESCDYSCYGCTDELAFNFESEATIDDGSCVYASQLMVNDWSVESNCDGFLMATLIDIGASEITIEQGENEGDLVVDLGISILEGTIDNNRNISVSGEGPTGIIQISGTGFLQSETIAIINITALTENCTLTLTLIE
ncbi:MAG: hypothetical protein VXZ76_01330 [Bacteroidota bacterium]|nr:hypothetical protein [Bacteroidota bacterium]